METSMQKDRVYRASRGEGCIHSVNLTALIGKHFLFKLVSNDRNSLRTVSFGCVAKYLRSDF